MGKRFWAGLLLASVVGAAFASGAGRGPGAVRKQIESSLLVEGTIDINADGSVAAYALPRAKDLPSGIVGMIDKVVPQWRFEPVELRDGTTRARATMHLRFVARKLDNGNFSVEVRGAWFGGDKPEESVSSRDRMTPPGYPEMAARAGVGGTVYTVLKIGRDGRVEDAIAEQVNLRVVANEASMQRWRDLLAKSALRAAKAWTFLPPASGEDVDAPYWSARVPVDFIAPAGSLPKPHQWQAYVPGPRARIPWRNDESDPGADAVAGGGVYPLDGGPRLLTALNPS